MTLNPPERITPRRRRAFAELLREKARAHPELRAPLTSVGLRAILERERVTVIVQPCERSAQLVPTPAGWVIMVNDQTSHAERFVLTLHELSHFWLHVNIDEIVSYDISPPWYDAVREAEADYLAEQLIAGPVTPVRKSKPVRKPRRQSAASNVPLGTRKAPPPLPLPGWLEEVERDADAVRLTAYARDAQRTYASEHPAPTGPTIQFAIDEAAWQAVHFSPGESPHYRRATAVPSGTTFVIVTCTPAVASRVVASLARAGHRRTAVFVRRRVRETLGLRQAKGTR